MALRITVIFDDMLDDKAYDRLMQTLVELGADAIAHEEIPDVIDHFVREPKVKKGA